MLERFCVFLSCVHYTGSVWPGRVSGSRSGDNGWWHGSLGVVTTDGDMVVSVLYAR